MGKWLAAGAFILAMFFVLGFSSSNSPEGKEKSSQRFAIEVCWKEQGRKSLDPSAARFAAGTCEMMEQRFRDRWGVNP